MIWLFAVVVYLGFACAAGRWIGGPRVKEECLMSVEGTETYWNGELTPARKVRAIVGEPVRPESVKPEHFRPWFADLVGETVDAVEVTYGRETFLLYDNDGSGWRKVTEGHGSPAFGHKGLPSTSRIKP